MNPLLYVFLIAMAPIVELRGAIPVGAVLKLPFWQNFLAALVGNMIPVPFILLFIPKILTWLEKFKSFEKIVGWVRRKADKHSEKILRVSFWGLLLFVMLPCPGTGAWTGSLVAALFDLPKKRSFLAVFLGVVGCGIIMTLASYGVLGFLSFLVPKS